jgi:diguanylate cyclase (GGDEF)-like protein
MDLDLPTLTVAGGVVPLLSGLVLLYAGLARPDARPAAIMGAAHLAGSLAIILLAVGSADGVGFTFAAQPLFVLSGMLFFVAIRCFESRRVPRTGLAAITMTIGLIVVLTIGGHSIVTAQAIQLTAAGTLYLLGACDLWLGRSEKLIARMPLAFLFALHASVLFIGLAALTGDRPLMTGMPDLVTLYGIIYAESMLFHIGTAFALFALVQQRREMRGLRAALVDPLTGLSNRRDLLEKAGRALERCRHDELPISLVMFDLDHFKAVNDTHGHALGDRVLQSFADAARKALRPGDILGRLGGEEFVAVLPGSGAEAGLAIAERVRASFELTAREINGKLVNATVSAGVSASEQSDTDLIALVHEADAALYRAKRLGRNRVTRAGEPGAGDYPKVLRVA